MWMRSCAICKALLHELQLCRSVRCQCGLVGPLGAHRARGGHEHCAGIIRASAGVRYFCFSRGQQVQRLSTMSEGDDAPPTYSQANT